jgi:hypothetical protein
MGTQLEAIGGVTTISEAQWGYLGAATGAITNVNDDVSVANLKTALASGFADNAVTIGDSSDVVTIGNHLTVTGNLTVNGSVTTLSTSTLVVDDSMISLAPNNTADTIDIGVYGKYVDGLENEKWSGIFRDADVAGKPFTFFSGVDAEPTATVTTTDAAGFRLADIRAADITAESFVGPVTGNASSATRLLTNRTFQTNLALTSGVSFNGLSNNTHGVTGILAVGNGGTGLTAITTLLNSNVTPSTLGLVIGTNVQAYDAQLDTLAAMTSGEINAFAALTETEIGVIGGLTATTAQLNRVDATSSIQTQLDAKEATISSSNRVNATNIGTGVVTNTELNYLTGVTSAIQTQLNNITALTTKKTMKLSGSTATTYTMTHSFGTPHVMVQLLDYGNNGTGATYDVVHSDVKRNSDNAIDVVFGTAPGGSQDYLVLITKMPAISA